LRGTGASGSRKFPNGSQNGIFRGLMAKRIAILGSTGSIGRNALKVIDSLGEGYEVAALSAHSNVELLAEQVKKYRPSFVAVTDASKADRLAKAILPVRTEILAGPSGMTTIAESGDVDLVLAAVVGAAGLPAILAGAKKGKTLAIANKEPLVMAGSILTETVRQYGATILPVDSEHCAIFQSMKSGSHDEVSKVILTASGGPFRTATAEQIRNATLEDALNHPTWNMGPKITIDSATMMNKALEVIEARWLFDMPVDRIDVLIHPESIVHSLVEFVDGSVIAQLGTPDMCLPIQYALTYPKRFKGMTSHLKLHELGKLTFHAPDLELFRALALGFEAAKAGGLAPAIMNAANEAAVAQFLAGKIKFHTIVELIEHCLDKHPSRSAASLDEVIEADRWARNEVVECLKQKVR
jgi:1-deoxy-D-xylulose-5-phosphate reductoisomerase